MAPSDKEAPASTASVTIVDDHLLFATALADLVRALPDFTVAGVAATGVEAIDNAREQQPDLILLDFHLPGVLATEILPDLRAASPESRIIILTSDTSSATRDASESAGVDGFLTKEQALDDVAEALRTVLRERPLAAQPAEDQARAEEQARLEEQARAQERQRVEEEARAQEDARAAEEQARLEEQQRLEEQRRLEEQARADEEARRAEEQRRLEEQARKEEEARRAEERARLEEEARAAERAWEEQQRLEEQARAEEQARLDEESRLEEQARDEEEARRAEEQARAEAQAQTDEAPVEAAPVEEDAPPEEVQPRLTAPTRTDETSDEPAVSAPVPGSAGPAEGTRGATGPRRGAVVAVYGAKGGVGTTTVAVNVGVQLAQKGHQVAVVDLDLGFGDVAMFLALDDGPGIADLALGDMDAETLSRTAARHESGLRLVTTPSIPAPVRPEASAVENAVDELRAHFGYVICDLPRHLGPLSLAMLRAADLVVIVTTPELPALRDLQRVLARSSLGLRERALLVLNRHPAKAGVSLRDVEFSIGLPVRATVPSDGVAVTEAVNRGKPFDKKGDRFARAFSDIAQKIVAALGVRSAG